MSESVDLDRLRTIGVRGDRHGARRTTRDELGHDTTEHWDGDRVDVTINVREPIRLKVGGDSG